VIVSINGIELSKLQGGFKAWADLVKSCSTKAMDVKVARSPSPSLLTGALQNTPTTTSSNVNESAVTTTTTTMNTSNLQTNTLQNEIKDDDDDNNDPKPWEEEEWIPRLKSGKRKSPNMIRNELQKYIDECKSNKTMTQGRIIEQMGVNNNTFRRFMNPKTYKDQWSATQNGTYWAAARLLEEVKYEKEKSKKSGIKRKASTNNENPAKKTKHRAEATILIHSINAVQGVPENIVYDTCPQLVTKIKDFLQRDGMMKVTLSEGLGGVNASSLNSFLAGKGQDQCGNKVYPLAYVFFEKLRILEGKTKTSARLKNEVERPYGFSLKKERAGNKWFLIGSRFLS